MQIHEITQASLREGVMSKVMGAIPSVASGFVQGFTGVNFPSPSDENPAAIERETRKRARQLAQRWTQKIKTQTKPQPARDKSSDTDPNWRQAALKSAGAAFGQAPADRPSPGQMPASVASSAQGQRMLQAYGQPRRGIQSIKEAPAEYTTASGIIIPPGTRTDPASLGEVDFEQWADQQLTTQITGTGQKIDLDAVKKDPAVKAELDKVLPQIKRDPTATAAVEMYFLIAMKAMQKLATAVKQKNTLGIK